MEGSEGPRQRAEVAIIDDLKGEILIKEDQGKASKRVEIAKGQHAFARLACQREASGTISDA